MSTSAPFLASQPSAFLKQIDHVAIQILPPGQMGFGGREEGGHDARPPREDSSPLRSHLPTLPQRLQHPPHQQCILHIQIFDQRLSVQSGGRSPLVAWLYPIFLPSFLLPLLL